MPTFDPPDGYDEALTDSSPIPVRVIRDEKIGEVLAELEIADNLIVVDPRYWLTDGRDIEKLRSFLEEYHGATHLIAVEAGAEDVRERVECDPSGTVRCIQRLYSAVDWPETAGRTIVFTLAPARSVAGLRFRSLSELRAGLLAKGGLNRDLPLESSVLDLGSPQGLLALSDRILEQMDFDEPDAGFVVHSRGVLLGAGCQVHPSARFVPPVIVHPGTQIDASAVVVGPALIGANTRIGHEAMVAQCLLYPGTEVHAGVTVRHRLCGGLVDGSDDHEDAPNRAISWTSLPNEWQWTKEMEALAEQRVDARRRVHLTAKRVLDVVLALAGLAVLAVPMLIVAILVKIDSAGPVFFTHRREGKDGREFSCLKFRTMSAGAHRLQRQLYRKNEVDGPQFKLKEDPRVTRAGRLLRVTNFDEVPQLLNVLAGHMSLVGPRPSPFRENQICVPWRRARLSVRPGITGLWQVCRDENRNEGDFHEWIYYDISYVRHFSFWLDLKILLATVLTLGGKWSVSLARLVPAAGQPGAAMAMSRGR